MSRGGVLVFVSSQEWELLPALAYLQHHRVPVCVWRGQQRGSLGLWVYWPRQVGWGHSVLLLAAARGTGSPCVELESGKLVVKGVAVQHPALLLQAPGREGRMGNPKCWSHCGAGQLRLNRK